MHISRSQETRVIVHWKWGTYGRRSPVRPFALLKVANHISNELLGCVVSWAACAFRVRCRQRCRTLYSCSCLAPTTFVVSVRWPLIARRDRRKVGCARSKLYSRRTTLPKPLNSSLCCSSDSVAELKVSTGRRCEARLIDVWVCGATVTSLHLRLN